MTPRRWCDPDLSLYRLLGYCRSCLRQTGHAADGPPPTTCAQCGGELRWAQAHPASSTDRPSAPPGANQPRLC